MKTLIAVCLVSLPAAAQAMGMSGGGCGRPSGACVHLAAVLYAVLAALGYWVLQHSEKEGQGLVKKTGRAVAFTLVAVGLIGTLCGVAGHIKASSRCCGSGDCRRCGMMAPGMAPVSEEGSGAMPAAGQEKSGSRPQCPIRKGRAG